MSSPRPARERTCRPLGQQTPQADRAETVRERAPIDDASPGELMAAGLLARSAAPLSNHVASYVVWFELCVVIRQPSWPPTLVLLPPLLQYPSGQPPLVVVSTCGKRIRPKLASSVPTCASAARIAFFML